MPGLSFGGNTGVTGGYAPGGVPGGNQNSGGGGISGGGSAPPGYEWDSTRGGYVPVGQAGKQPGAGTASSPQNPYNPNSPAQYAPIAGGRIGGTNSYSNDTESPALTGLRNEQGVQTSAEEALAAQAGGIASSSMNQQAKLQAEAEQRRLQMFQSLWGTSGTGGTGGAVGQVAPVDLTTPMNNAMARAKDQAGLITQGAMTGLRDAYAGTGNVGGYEQGVAQAVGSGAGGLGDVNRELAIQQGQAGQQAALTNYQGAVTQRGQNLAQQQALLGLITSRALY